MNLSNITIKEYLIEKGISFRESGKELVVKCLFNDCDRDSKANEAHLYFNKDTGQYDCKKCGEKGNIVTLAKYLGDNLKDTPHPQTTTSKINQTKTTSTPITSFHVDLVEKYHLALPANIRQYLIARGIPDGIINQFKLGWGNPYGKYGITIPITNKKGEFIFLKIRRDPTLNDKENKFLIYPKGSETNIYGWDTINNQRNDYVVICEGELDRLVLISKGIPAITSTGGAGTFKEEWIKELLCLEKIYICYDNDQPGQDGKNKLIKLLSELDGPEIFEINLPEEVGPSGDITDYFTKLNGNKDKLFNEYCHKITTEIEDRIIQIIKPKKPIEFSEWKQTIKDNFPELLLGTEIGISILAQILITDISNPFSLVLVDTPSSGKTISINFFDKIEGITYATDKFTPASFVSSACNISKDKLAEVDLLPRIKNKVLLIRDLATLFSKREDDLQECMGILTRVLDGEGLSIDSGIHGKRSYTGNYLFMILAATTPISPKVWKIMGNIGSRLFFLNLNTKEKNEEELANQLSSNTCKLKEKKCHKITKDFIHTLWSQYPQGINWNNDQDKQEYKIIISRCAKLLARLRGVINVWKEKYDIDANNEYNFTPPNIEKPDRINQLFYNLARGHTLACGRSQINFEDLRLIIELSIDSAPTTRSNLFRKLLDNDGKLLTNQVEKLLHCSKPTALKEMETLAILGICNIDKFSSEPGGPEHFITLKNEFEWFLGDECKLLRNPEYPKYNTTSDLLN